MKLAVGQSDVVASGPTLGQFSLGINEGDFSLAMQVLIDLYQNPIGSIVRELGSNAIDAHVMAGKGHLPIEITLPAPLSPYLIVRDTGLGMSREFITDTYSKLLSSTKREGNVEIGGYGIGSKSPLGYTDSYTLTTRYKGEELHVHVSRDGGFTLLGSNQTNEVDGTTVTVPVNSQDCDAFRDAVKWLRYMTPAPLINGEPIPTEEVLLSGTSSSLDWGGGSWFIANKDTPYGADPLILLGPIPYPLDTEHLGGLSSEMRTVARANYLRLQFPIGSLTVTPSRESLRYDQHTIDAIRAALCVAYDPIRSSILELLDECEYVSQAQLLHNGYNFREWWSYTNEPLRLKRGIELPVDEQWAQYQHYSWKENVSREKIKTYPSHSNVEVFLDDKPTYARQRINAYVDSLTGIQVIVGPLDSSIQGQKLFPTRLLSELPEVVRDVTIIDEEGVVIPKLVVPRLAKGTIRARVWTPHSVSHEKVLLYAYTEDTTMPLDGTGYYLVMSAGKVEHTYVEMPLDAEHILLMQRVLQCTGDLLYIIPPQAVPRLGNGWKDMLTEVHKTVKPWLTWAKHLYLAPSIPMQIYGVDASDYAKKGIDGYLLEYLKLATEAQILLSKKGSSHSPKEGNHLLYDLVHFYGTHLTTLWKKIPMHSTDPLTELQYLVRKVYPLLLDSRPDMRYYLDMLNHAMDSQRHRPSLKECERPLIGHVTPTHNGEWFQSCKLTTGHPTATMTGRELMIHYYQGTYGDVTSYCERYHV